MLNEFLTSTLQVVILLDVLGLVAWFVLAARRGAHKTATSSEATLRAASEGTLWSKLTGSRHRLQAGTTVRRVGRSLDDSLAQLRSVLESYRTSLV